MSEDYGSDILTLTDDDGLELELELLDSLEYQGNEYRLLWPLAIDGEPVEEDSDDCGFVILRLSTEDGEDMLCTVDDQAEADAVYELFMERLEEAEDGEDE